MTCRIRRRSLPSKPLRMSLDDLLAACWCRWKPILALQSQLEGTENRIAVSRRDYNEAVRDYNTRIRTFPEMIGAKLVHGAKPMTPFEATTQGAEEAPKVDFGA